jgi:hypothetical protein
MPFNPFNPSPFTPSQPPKGAPPQPAGQPFSGGQPSGQPGGLPGGQQGGRTGNQPAAPEAPTVFKFEERADYEKGFESYFEEKIKPVLKDLDKSRMEIAAKLKQTRPKANLILWGGLVIGLALTIWSQNATALIFIGFLAVAIRQAMLTAPGGELASQFKSKIIPLVINFFGDFQYKEFVDADEQMLNQSTLFDYFTSATAQDFIAGVYHGNKFSFSEMHLVRHSGKNNVTIIFKGMLLMLEMPNTLQGKTMIKRDKDKTLWNKITGTSNDMRNFKLDNPDLENVFEAYTSNEAEARNLLIPQFMDGLKKLNDLYSAKGVRCSFFDNKLLLAISYGFDETAGKLFESQSAYKMVLDVEEIHKFLAQFHGILEIIDTVLPKAPEI